MNKKKANKKVDQVIEEVRNTKRLSAALKAAEPWATEQYKKVKDKFYSLLDYEKALKQGRKDIELVNRDEN